MGFILTTEGVKPDPARVQAIKEIPEPRTREELQKFIGMCTYYRRFYKEYARYLEPFRELMSSSQKFKWQDKHHIAFNMLRNKLSDHVLLNHYRRDRPFCLQTDGSKTGISAILFQYDDDGNELVIALISRCLTSYEKNYTAAEIELLAIMYAVVKLRNYLLGQTFLIITDHQSLTFLLKTTYYSSCLMRWSLLLQHYSYEITHCQDKENIIADYFSRVSPEGMNFEATHGPTNSNLIVREPTEILCAIKVAKPWIPELRHIKNLQEQDSSLDRWRRRARAKNSVIKIVEGVLFYKGKRDEHWRIVIPIK